MRTREVTERENKRETENGRQRMGEGGEEGAAERGGRSREKKVKFTASRL